MDCALRHLLEAVTGLAERGGGAMKLTGYSLIGLARGGGYAVVVVAGAFDGGQSCGSLARG